MDIVLGVSMAPAMVRLVLVEGANADGVTVEQDSFDLGAARHSAASPAVEQVIAAIDGTRQGAVEGGYQLTSTGVTWTDPAEVAALREALAARDFRNVMLVSPLLAAAALAQTVGQSIGYERIAMLFVEPENATLAVVEVADGSIIELHRQPLHNARPGVSQGATAAVLATMVADLDARQSRADGVFLIGCGMDIVSIKAALEAATPLAVTAPEEPDMALARGAALASANAPLFASSTAALAYALDPGTGEVGPRGLAPTYLGVSADADFGGRLLAYSALEDEDDQPPRRGRRGRRGGSLLLSGSALAAIAAVVVGVVLVSLTSDRPMSAVQHKPGVNVATPAQQVPAQAPSGPPEAQLPPSPAPTQAQLPSPSPAPPPPEAQAAAPPAPSPTQQRAPRTPVNRAPATPLHRAPTRGAPEYVPTPEQQAAPPPVAPAPPPEAPAPPPEAPVVPRQPPMTMYLHLPFVTVPIPINPPQPPPAAPSQ